MSHYRTGCNAAAQISSTSQYDWMRELGQVLLGPAPDRSGLGDCIDRALLLAKDDWIKAACICWPAHALTILRTAEHLSEAHTDTRDGVASQLSLVAIPVMFEFEHDIAASLFEQSLNTGEVARNIAASFAGNDHIVLSPHLYTFEQIASVPLSRVRRALQELVEGRFSCQPPTTHMPCTYKRRSRFLRYLLGRYFSPAIAGFPFTDAFAPELSGYFIEQHVYTTLGVRAKVRALFDNGYHASVYAGLWRYQQSRVCQLACDRLVNGGALVSVDVHVNLHDLGHDLELDLVTQGRAPPHPPRTYLLKSRPGDTPAQSLDLVIRAARGAGIKSIQTKASGSRTAATLRLPI